MSTSSKTVTNPNTGRLIKVGGKTWKKLSPTSQRKSLRSITTNDCKNEETFKKKTLVENRYIKLSNGYCFDVNELIKYVNRNPHNENLLLFELHKDEDILSNPKLKNVINKFFEMKKIKSQGASARGGGGTLAAGGTRTKSKSKKCEPEDVNLVTHFNDDDDYLNSWEELPISRIIRFKNGYCYDIAFIVMNLTNNFNSLNGNNPRPVFPRDPFTNVEYTVDEIKMIKNHVDRLKIIPKNSPLNVFLGEKSLWIKPTSSPENEEYLDWIMKFADLAKTKYGLRIQYHGVDSIQNFTGRWVHKETEKTTFEILKDMYLDTDIYKSWNEDVHNGLYFFGAWTRFFNTTKYISFLENLIVLFNLEQVPKNYIIEYILKDFEKNTHRIFNRYNIYGTEQKKQELIKQYTKMVNMYLNNTSLTAIKLIENIGNEKRNYSDDYAIVTKNLPSLKTKK